MIGGQTPKANFLVRRTQNLFMLYLVKKEWVSLIFPLLTILLVKPSGIIYVQASMILLYMTGSSILTFQINNSEEAARSNRDRTRVQHHFFINTVSVKWITPFEIFCWRISMGLSLIFTLPSFTVTSNSLPFMVVNLSPSFRF